MKIGLLYLLVGYLLEGITTFYFFKSKVTGLGPLSLLFLILHAAAVILFSYGIYRGSIHLRFNSPKNWLIMCIAACFVFPAIGFFFMTAIFLLLRKRHEIKDDAFDDYKKYVSFDYEPEKKYLPTGKLIEAIEDKLEVSPLVDVMGDKDAALRRGAVNIMDRLPRKDAVRLLKMSLGDNNTEIRFHSAVRLSEVEAELNNNIIMAQKEVEHSPDSIDAHLALANACAEYYESDILDQVTSDYYMDLALAEYYKVLELGETDDIRVLNAVGNLQTHKKEYDEALLNFQNAFKIDSENVYTNVGIIHIYFEKGEIDKVIDHSKKVMKKMPKTKGPMREIINYWASTG